jgi:hypothetical protein
MILPAGQPCRQEGLMQALADSMTSLLMTDTTYQAKKKPFF